MKKNSGMRVLVGPLEIAGYYSNLTLGMKALGVDVDFITYHSHPFGYGGETRQPVLLRVAKWFNRLRGVPRRVFPLKVIYALPGEIFSAMWAINAIFRYDVYIFGFGRSLLPLGLDLPLLRILGKKVITNLAHGSETRPVYINGALQTKEGVRASPKLLFSRGRKMAQMVDRHFRYASVVIGAPFSSSQNARGRFINLFALGIPFKANEVENATATDCNARDEESEVIRILHAPSHPAGKGSHVIISAIEGLRKKGYLIQFLLIHGQPFSEVLAEIKKCDFVVDQIYSDTPMAGFATEAAWFGKPAVVGGYGLERLIDFVPDGMWPPSKTCHPDKIESAIEELIMDKRQLKQLGIAAQAFVREKWNAVEVAKRFLRLIEGDIPEEWWINPENIIYVDGWGQSQETTRQVIRKMVSEYGVTSLQLSHRPDLERAFLKFAGIESSLDSSNA